MNNHPDVHPLGDVSQNLAIFHIINSIEEGITDVRLSVCLQNMSKCYGQILMKFSGNVDHDIRKSRLDFGSDLDHSGSRIF